MDSCAARSPDRNLFDLISAANGSPHARWATVMGSFPLHLKIFSTCPPSSRADSDYRQKIAHIAQWSERAGCTGLLIYTDNSVLDPWLIAQIVIQETRLQVPLVAVQPVYMHPYSVAKTITSLAFLYGRRVALNMVAGGFRNDLASLNDTVAHDERYERLVEYLMLIRKLLEGESVSLQGRFYSVSHLKLQPEFAPELMPQVLVSGSSEAGLRAARAMGATAIRYPEPAAIEEPGNLPRADKADGLLGVRIGMLCRPMEEEAWRIAYERFPQERRGQITRAVASKISDSIWHGQLAALTDRQTGAYWLQPFANYQSNCPYLVGSYESVARELAAYIRAGNSTYILDVPAAEEEFQHITAVFELASDFASDNRAVANSAATN